MIYNLSMWKLLFVTFLLVLTPALTDKEILQQGFNGLFDANGLPHPEHVVDCFSDPTAHKLVIFIGEILEKAARGSVKDIIQLKDLIEKFGDQIPESEKKSLDESPELEKLKAKYPIDDKT